MVPCLMRSSPPRSTPHCKVTKARLRSQLAGRWPAPVFNQGRYNTANPGERGAAAPGPSTPGSRSSVAGIPVKCSRNRRQVRRNPQPRSHEIRPQHADSASVHQPPERSATAWESPAVSPQPTRGRGRSTLRWWRRSPGRGAQGLHRPKPGERVLRERDGAPGVSCPARGCDAEFARTRARCPRCGHQRRPDAAGVPVRWSTTRSTGVIPLGGDVFALEWTHGVLTARLIGLGACGWRSTSRSAWRGEACARRRSPRTTGDAGTSRCRARSGCGARRPMPRRSASTCDCASW